MLLLHAQGADAISQHQQLGEKIKTDWQLLNNS